MRDPLYHEETRLDRLAADDRVRPRSGACNG